VFWTQASSLRGDFESLKKEQPELAKGLEDVGRRLDGGRFSNLLRGPEEPDIPMNSAENIRNERRHLVSEWERLVEEARQISGFEYFLKLIPFSQLRQAAPAGQVSIINVSQYGVDAVIFGATGPIEHVSLTDIDHDELTELSKNMVSMRPINSSELQRRSYVKRYLKPALRKVWGLILVHIFNHISIPLTAADNTPPSRRIWWYPTGPLTFIPVHAAGPVGGATDVSRLVISSYVTTIGSILQARKNSRPITKVPQKLLTVSQAETLGESSLPQTMGEVDDITHVFRSSGWSDEDIICLHGSDATVSRVSCALDICSWVHLACHGSQDAILGMKSAFSLHDGSLKLNEIASKWLSVGQFAFLSTCHAASGLEGLPGEATHLAAGIQFAGFPSVIATLWRIRDEDAPKLAGHF